MNSIINRVFHNNHVIFPLWVELSVGGIVHGWKCPGWDCLGWKCPWVGLSVGGSVLGGIVLGGTVRGWKCPGWKCPGGIVRGGSVLAPKISEANFRLGVVSGSADYVCMSTP